MYLFELTDTYKKQSIISKIIERKIMIQELDDKYRTTIINFNKYPAITFAMAKMMEMTKEEQNQIFFYLYNKIRK